MSPAALRPLPVAPSVSRRLKPLHAGCSGWNYASWRGALYPPGLPQRRWLERYAEVFGTVEVNSTFYRLAHRAAVQAWVEQTPAGFVFAVKASRFLTHVKRLSGVADGISRFYEPIEPLVAAGRLGPVLWQLPETFHRDDARLAETLELLPGGRHAFEFRHPSWFAAPVLALLAEHDAALVLGDHPARAFQSHEATAAWRYIRFHHGARGRRGNYSAAELDEWARRLHGWRRASELYVYFNDDWEAFAPRNALSLRTRLRRLAGEGEDAL
jgi:uncharacterized protein YecE (DUF72 family)